VILVGEMRDLETVSSAITAAQTGHLVLSTIHTTNTIQIISRILDLYPPHQQNQVRLQLAETLKGAISQRLLPLADGSGRVAAQEILVVTPHIQKAIEDNSLVDVTTPSAPGNFTACRPLTRPWCSLQPGKDQAGGRHGRRLQPRGIHARRARHRGRRRRPER
jgi:Tfp pilus assembly pilus retraction ATPase PilT